MEDEYDILFEMANLHKRDSKLPKNLYFTCGGDHNITNHNALRIKVQMDNGESLNPGNLATLVFNTTPDYGRIIAMKWVGDKSKVSEISASDKTRIIRYIRSNWDTVVNHWREEINDKEFLDLMPSEKRR